MNVGVQLVTIPIVVPIMDKEFGMNDTEKVLITQAFFGGQFIGSILGGYLGDKYGRRVVILYSNMIAVILGYLSAYSDSVILYTLLRLPIGVCIGTSVVLRVYLDEVAFKGWR